MSDQKTQKLDMKIIDEALAKNNLCKEEKISFKDLKEEHISLMMKWLKEPHVAEFWQESEDEGKIREKFLNSLLNCGVRPQIICLNEQPIGYIQVYQACLIGNGWWTDAKPGTFGIDQFIGDPKFINKGLGTKIICSFVHQIFQDQSVTEIIADPLPTNLRAIKSYKKVGFKEVHEIETPSGTALLMRLTRLDPV